MLFSYVVYTLLVLVVCSATFYVWKNCNVRYSVLLIPSFCYAFLVGMRYDVGADWFSYHDYYIYVLAGGDLDLEFAYVFLWLELSSVLHCSGITRNFVAL